MLVVDPWLWLEKDGGLPVDNPYVYRRMLRIARFIECGGPLATLEMRETLVACMRRPSRKACPGLIWVMKTSRDSLTTFCSVCKEDEVEIENWQRTCWATGLMAPVSLITPTFGG